MADLDKGRCMQNTAFLLRLLLATRTNVNSGGSGSTQIAAQREVRDAVRS